MDLTARARPIWVVLLVAALGLSLGGCSKSPRSARVKVGLITKTETNPFFDKMKQGAQKPPPTTASPFLPPPASCDAADMLTGRAARLYLRIGTERDGTSLYRLCHQGLADYLREHPHSPGRREQAERHVFDALIATRRDNEGRAWWESAPPYLKRHAIHHAAEASAVDRLLIDPEFLVHADSATLILELDQAFGDDARLAAAIYRTSAPLLP